MWRFGVASRLQRAGKREALTNDYAFHCDTGQFLSVSDSPTAEVALVAVAWTPFLQCAGGYLFKICPECSGKAGVASAQRVASLHLFAGTAVLPLWSSSRTTDPLGHAPCVFRQGEHVCLGEGHLFIKTPHVSFDLKATDKEGPLQATRKCYK